MTTEDITVSLNVTGENPTSQIFKGIQHLPEGGFRRGIHAFNVLSRK